MLHTCIHVCFFQDKLILPTKKYENIYRHIIRALYRALKPFEITNIRIRDIDLRPTNFNSVRSCSRKTSKLQASSRIVYACMCVGGYSSGFTGAMAGFFSSAERFLKAEQKEIRSAERKEGERERCAACGAERTK